MELRDPKPVTEEQYVNLIINTPQHFISSYHLIISISQAGEKKPSD